jgi:hypothetical protein
MSKAMPIYIADILSETEHLTAEEFGAFMLLLMFSWDHAPIPIGDERSLANIVGSYDLVVWKRVRAAVLPMFDERGFHAKLEVEKSRKRRGIGGAFGVLPSISSNPLPEDWPKRRHEVFERDAFTCRYCGQFGGKLECDHVVPRSRGGGHEIENLVTSCKPCNRRKRNKLLEEWLVQ